MVARMRKSLVTTVLAGIAIVLAAAAAIAGATSVSTKPEPAFITRSPATTTTTAPGRVDLVPVTADDHRRDHPEAVDDHDDRDGRGRHGA
jgi:hypothetical protein